ncbi:MAG TPA: S53 family peptidase [Streptosporangiaceae bacterium]|nr:S53 family peptidase [Streptosporangiaceae bacterium]
MSLTRRLAILGTGTALAVATAVSGMGAATASQVSHATVSPPILVKVLGHLANGKPMLSNATPTGLPPSAIQSVYNLSGLSPSSGAGAGQIIAIVDAYNDPNALSDLNTFNAQYGYAQLSTCTSLTQSGPCFEQVFAQGSKPKTNSGWVLEESLDIEWAHAEAPAAKIVLVEAASNSFSNLFGAIVAANNLSANVVSMSWGGGESSSETSTDSDFTHAGTFYTASSGDSGHGVIYPSASPNVIAVGGTTLNGCSGTKCSFTSETAWSGSGGGISADEALPGYQSSYTGPVSGASSISALTGGKRGVPDVSFEANPNTGVSVFDSTADQGQSGWFTIGGTSVGAPNWAGILAAGTAAGKTALQGDSAIYSGGFSTLRDVTSGTNGTCGTDCTAGTGYDLVTGLGSPINYP